MTSVLFNLVHVLKLYDINCTNMWFSQECTPIRAKKNLRFFNLIQDSLSLAYWIKINLNHERHSITTYFLWVFSSQAIKKLYTGLNNGKRQKSLFFFQVKQHQNVITYCLKTNYACFKNKTTEYHLNFSCCAGCYYQLNIVLKACLYASCCYSLNV